jgi:CheY-like chemotaxis protein
MADYHILIVDNQRKQRRDLRSGVESLGSDFRVIDAPSGEEALLLLSRQPIHLLVSEYRLAGMTGLELMQKVRQSQPEVKTIFISEPGQTKFKTQATQAGADAFLFKPVDMAEFLKAVERCLGLSQVEPTGKPEVKTQRPTPITGLTEILEDLRQQLHAIAVLLMDREGRAALRAGELPPGATDASLQAALKATFDAGVKISWALGRLPPEDLAYFSGVKFDIYLAHIGQSTALVVLTEPARDAETRGRIMLHLPPTVNALLHGFSTRDRLPAPPAGSLSGPDVTGEDSPLDLELDVLLSQASNTDARPTDIDSFWETAAEQASREGLPKAGALSYEQARKLGLAPKDDAQG